MNRIRVHKIFRFEAAHALYGYDGPCRNIHGHSYQLSVCLIGSVNQLENHPKNGMVIDFSLIKPIIHTAVIEPFDHALLLNGNSPHRLLADKNEQFDKILLLPYQPTCENLLTDIVMRVLPMLPDGINLHHVSLKETATSCAEWYAEDN